MDIAAINALIEDDMKLVDALILRRLQSDVVLINQVGHYIVNSGGKRLRPIIVLLAARALNYRGDGPYRSGRHYRIHPHRHPAA